MRGRFSHTMLDEIQTNASNDWYLVCGHGTQEPLNGDNFIRHLCFRIKDIVVRDHDNVGLQTSLFCCRAHVEVF